MLMISLASGDAMWLKGGSGRGEAEGGKGWRGGRGGRAGHLVTCGPFFLSFFLSFAPRTAQQITRAAPMSRPCYPCRVHASLLPPALMHTYCNHLRLCVDCSSPACAALAPPKTA